MNQFQQRLHLWKILCVFFLDYTLLNDPRIYIILKLMYAIFVNRYPKLFALIQTHLETAADVNVT